MASLILRKLIAGDVELNDLGLTFQGVIGSEFDIMGKDATAVSASTDTTDAITNLELIVLDPRDATTVLSVADSIMAIENHNQTHYGIQGGRFSEIDAPDYSPVTNDLVRINAAGVAEQVAPADVINSAAATEAVEDIVGAMVIDGADTTADYDEVNNTLTFEVKDNYLRNDGDTLDSGTLTIDSGATLDIATGATLTIQDAPTDGNDAVNKDYVDSVVGAKDHKESVQVATTGQQTLTPAAGTTTIDGVVLSDGDRVLFKNQTDATENGIYVASSTGAGDPTVFTRAADQDGIGGDASAGNFTFVEQGTTNGSTGWVVTGTGDIDVDTDPMNWTQQSGQGSYTAGQGLNLTGTVFTLNTNNLTVDTAETTDTITFYDVSEGQDNKTSIADFIADMDIVTSTGIGGFATEISDGVFANRTLEIEAAGPLAGLAVTNGDGISGNPIFGLDIQNLPASAAVDATNDRVAVWDSSTDTNVYYTVGELAGAVATTNSFETWAAAGNTTGDASFSATSAVDSVTLVGGNGINIDLNASTDTLAISFVKTGLTAAVSESTDTIVFFDGSNSDAPATTTIAGFIADNDLVTGDSFGSGTGILVKTGESPDTYESREVVASTTAQSEGAVVVNGDGIAGNIEVGVDIASLTDSTVDMVAGDEFIVNDGTNNVAMSGTQVAEGVRTVLGLPAFALSTINGQPVVTVADTTRSDKLLSVDSVVFTWGENNMSNLDWMTVGSNATDADSGFIMPMDGTVVYATAHCENTDTNSKNIHLYIDGVDQGSLGALTGGENVEFVDNTINIDFTQGQKIRLRAVGSGTGQIEDTVASVFVKWRAAV